MLSIAWPSLGLSTLLLLCVMQATAASVTASSTRVMEPHAGRVGTTPMTTRCDLWLLAQAE